jgi:hypothetical protein
MRSNIETGRWVKHVCIERTFDAKCFRFRSGFRANVRKRRSLKVMISSPSSRSGAHPAAANASPREDIDAMRSGAP